MLFQLRPTDVSRLCVAIGLYLTTEERHIFMNPVLEVFPNITRYDRNLNKGEAIVLIGKDIRNITNYNINRIEFYLDILFNSICASYYDESTGTHPPFKNSNFKSYVSF